MATKKKWRKIPSTTKSRILSESLMPGCLISDLAKSYGVSRQIIYSWRKGYKTIKSKSEAGAGAVIQTQVEDQVQTLAVDGNSQTSLESVKSNDESESQFVELRVQDSGSLALKKASLIFSDFALTIEGSVPSSSLVSILKILEREAEPC